MSLCPVCGDMMCDHTPAERGQTWDEMMRFPTKEEFDLVGDAIHMRSATIKLKVARLYVHYRPGDPHPKVE